MPESLRAPVRQAGRKKGYPVSEENKALVRRQEELFSGGNLDVADEIYASDYVGHDPSNPEDVRGLEAAKQAASDYRQAFPDLRVTVEDLIAEGDRVAARLRVRGTHLGELNGIPPRAGGWIVLGLS
jgi:predicted ester cyclase